VHGGGGWNKFTGRPDGSDRSGSSANGSGAVAGGQIGGLPDRPGRARCRRPYAWSDIKVSEADRSARRRPRRHAEERLSRNGRGRLGYAFDRVLIYGKGGAASPATN